MSFTVVPWLNMNDRLGFVFLAAEDETAEGRLSREEGLYAAGWTRLLLRRIGPDAAFLL